MKTKLKSKRGITLIALIITIIILLILAMVTIRILMNQGIIKHAQNATEAYNEAQNNETEYLTYAEGEMDKYAGVSGGSGDATEQGPDDLQKYLLGVNLEGRSIFDVLDGSTSAFKDKDEEESIISASTKVKLLNLYPYAYDETTENGIVYAFYVKYNNAAYKVMTKGQTFTTDPTAGVTKVYEPKSGSKEGTIVHYSVDGTSAATDWLVLYDNGSTLDIMSVNTMKKAGDANGLTLGNSNLDSAIDSYNSAVATINNYCNDLITNTTAQNVRSVGSKPDFSTTDTTATYSSDKTDNWQPAYNGKGKVGDTNAESDIIRMSFYDLSGSSLGYAKSNADYWLASRLVGERSSYVYFDAGSVNSDGVAYDGYGSLWYVLSGSAYGNYASYAVRPVVRVAVSDVS